MFYHLELAARRDQERGRESRREILRERDRERKGGQMEEEARRVMERKRQSAR
jgi:hypothetical protein